MDMEAGAGGVISGPGMKNMIMVNLKKKLLMEFFRLSKKNRKKPKIRVDNICQV